MYCRVCGTERSVKYRAKKLQALCGFCNASTPAKVSRDTFEQAYFGEYVNEVPASTRSEFFSDYLASTLDLSGYIAATTQAA